MLKNNLHSTLIKYKVSMIFLNKLMKSYLHSTLIKYKGRIKAADDFADDIYIPLWLNIKEEAVNTVNYAS